MQAHSPGMHFARHKIAEALTMLPDAKIRNVYYKSDTTLPYKAHLDPDNEYLVGNYDGNIAIENGLQFNIDWLKGTENRFLRRPAREPQTSLKAMQKEDGCSTCSATREVSRYTPCAVVS